MWVQDYNPTGIWQVSTMIAALPVLVLLGLLAAGRVPAWKAALAGLITACVVAMKPFGMPPQMVLAGAAVGGVFAMVRIVWLIVAAVFLYDITVETGQFEVMKASIARLSADRRLQAVLVAFCFGALIEGAAGFGAPVAISAAFLVGLGFRPFQAALLCLIANTAPVAWGGIGIPVLTLSTVTGLDVRALSATCGRILPMLSVVIPFWLVATLTSWRKTWEVRFPLLVIGGTFATVQFVWSNYVGFELVDIASSVASLCAGVVVVRVWRPREVWRFEGDPDPAAAKTDGLTTGRVARAWMPFAMLTAFVLIWGLPASKTLGTPSVKDWLDGRLSWKTEMPGLHLKVVRGEAVTGHEVPTSEDREKAPLEFVPLSATGTAVFLAAVASGFLLGLPTTKMARLFLGTIRRMIPAIVAILCMLALGFVTKYCGHGCRARPGLHADRADTLSDLRDAPGLAGGGADRFGHGEQRAFRQPPEDHRAEAGPRPDPDGVGEHHRRRDGQDDRRAIDRGRGGGDRRGGKRGRPAPRRAEAQHPAGPDRRRDRLVLRAHRAGIRGLSSDPLAPSSSAARPCRVLSTHHRVGPQ